MIISIANASAHWGNPCEFPVMSYMSVHACACVCACVWDTPIQHPYPPNPTPHTPIHPHPNPTREMGTSKNSIGLKLIKIFQFCLKI